MFAIPDIGGPPPPPISPVPQITNPELALLLSRVPFRRVPTITQNGLPTRYRGLYEPQRGISIREDERDPIVAREEYLHAAQHRYQPFSSDFYAGFPSFRQALENSYGRLPESYGADPFHTFSGEAVKFLDDPESVHQALRYYLEPLIRQPRPEVSRGPR